MRLLFIFGLLITSSLFAQEKYAFVHFNESNMSPDSKAFLKENDEVLVFGRLSNTSYWALLDVDVEEVAMLKSTYSTDVVFWNQRIGQPCSLAKSKENSELTFIKYNSHITKFNVQEAPELFRLHDDHIKTINKTGNVLLEGYFDNDDGGFMLMKGSLDKQVILTDRAVENGIIELEIYSTVLETGKDCK